MNDVDDTFVNNFQIEYEFEFNKGIVNSFYEIHNKDYHKYFENRVKLNDTIMIIYNPENPKENEIIKKK